MSEDVELPGACRWMLKDGRNVILDRLAKKLPVMALGVRSSRTIDVAKAAQNAGNQVLWIDLEHSTMPIDIAAQMCSAALDTGLVPIVRIPEKDYGVIGRLLDGGAVGIMAARVETAAQAAEIAAACRFPPRGCRSQIGALPLFGLRKVPPKLHNDLANRATIVVISVETEIGFRNVEAIAAVDGVDLVISGNNDFSADLGMLGEYRNDAVYKANAAAIKACAKSGKGFAVGGISDMKYMREMIDLGAAPFFITGIDSEMLRDAAQDKVNSIMGALK
jgi:4-hydroxy-2-oxoheptanedioate aldolase